MNPQVPYVLELPIPPPVGHYYQPRRMKVKKGPKVGKVYTGMMIGERGLAYRSDVEVAVRRGHRVPPELDGRLAIIVFVNPPDHKKRDLDNLWKSVLDALTKARVIKDDVLFDDIRMIRGNIKPGGRLLLSIYRFDPIQSFMDASEAGIKEAENDLFK